jgi:hypothetical protein
MNTTEVNKELTRIARAIFLNHHPEASEDVIDKELNLYPLSPWWSIASLIHRRQKEFGIKII